MKLIKDQIRKVRNSNSFRITLEVMDEVTGKSYSSRTIVHGARKDAKAKRNLVLGNMKRSKLFKTSA